jgi:hypothetical protein
MKKTTFFPDVAGLAALALAVMLGAGCRSSSAQRDLMSDDLTAGERPVAMKGEGSFLDGKLTATATVSRGFDRGAKAGAKAGGKGGDRAGKKERESGFGDTYSIGGGGDSEEEQQAAMEDYMRLVRAQRAAGSPMPPVTLRVKFANHTTEPMEIEVTEVNSELGNFAVRPPKLTLAPGQDGALDPMISQLGVTSDEIPIKVVVRSASKAETQTIMVKNLRIPEGKK